MVARVRYACVVDGELPDQDYRVLYASHSKVVHSHFFMPARPAGVSASDYCATFIRSPQSWRFWSEVLSLPKKLRGQKIEVAHFFSMPLYLIGPPLARCSGIRTIFTVTGLGRAFSSDRSRITVRVAYRILFILSCIAADRVLFQKAADLAELARFTPAFLRDKFSVVGTAIDVQVGARDRTTSGDNAILYVGRLIPEKGIEDVLLLAEYLAESLLTFPPIRIVGDTDKTTGPLRGRLETAATQGHIQLVGKLSGPEVIMEMQSASLLIFPSTYPEGIPRVLLEAAVVGLPCVAYDLPGARAALGEAGVYTLSNDIDGLRVAVLSVLADLETTKARASSAREWTREEHSIQRYTERLDSIVLTAANSRHASPATSRKIER